MAVLSFAKNKFLNFLSLSNTATPSAPDLFPSSSSSTKSLDSYFSLSPNLSLPCVATIPQVTQASPANSGSVPLIPPGFSPLPTHSPIATLSTIYFFYIHLCQTSKF